eukprot:scaffold98819_cov29-Tisochrysis_lutea.AAC.2
MLMTRKFTRHQSKNFVLSRHSHRPVSASKGAAYLHFSRDVSGVSFLLFGRVESIRSPMMHLGVCAIGGLEWLTASFIPILKSVPLVVRHLTAVAATIIVQVHTQETTAPYGPHLSVSLVVE